jgi:hypothetical protein
MNEPSIPFNVAKLREPRPINSLLLHWTRGDCKAIGDGFLWVDEEASEERRGRAIALVYSPIH